MQVSIVNFIEWGNQNVVSPQGDIFDSWGTPLKFYFSSDEVLFRSAGNKKIECLITTMEKQVMISSIEKECKTIRSSELRTHAYARLLVR